MCPSLSILTTNNIKRLVALCLFACAFTLEAEEFSRTFIDSYKLEFAPAGEVQIAYKVIPAPADAAEAQTLVMVMGLGANHGLWGDQLIQGLHSEGLQIVLIDNRDVGASTKFTEFGDPILWWELIKNYLGFEVDAAYELKDMASDVLAVMDHLELQQAHVVGASMGGMISQVLAAVAPDRVRTLTSIMSTTGATHLPPPSAEANEQMMNAAGGEGEGEALKRMMAMGLEPEAMPRQILAVLKSGDRSAQVATIKVPSLVIHGEKDALLSIEHGQHTAELIPNARFVSYADMAHDFPPSVVPKIIAEIVSHISAE